MGRKSPSLPGSKKFEWIAKSNKLNCRSAPYRGLVLRNFGQTCRKISDQIRIWIRDGPVSFPATVWASRSGPPTRPSIQYRGQKMVYTALWDARSRTNGFSPRPPGIVGRYADQGPLRQTSFNDVCRSANATEAIHFRSRGRTHELIRAACPRRPGAVVRPDAPQDLNELLPPAQIQGQAAPRFASLDWPEDQTGISPCKSRPDHRADLAQGYSLDKKFADEPLCLLTTRLYLLRVARLKETDHESKYSASTVIWRMDAAQIQACLDGLTSYECVTPEPGVLDFVQKVFTAWMSKAISASTPRARNSCPRHCRRHRSSRLGNVPLHHRRRRTPPRQDRPGQRLGHRLRIRTPIISLSGE